jgi:hypothetical protein
VAFSPQDPLVNRGFLHEGAQKAPWAKHLLSSPLRLPIFHNANYVRVGFEIGSCSKTVDLRVLEQPQVLLDIHISLYQNERRTTGMHLILKN